MKRDNHIFAFVLLLFLIGFASGQKEIPTTFTTQNKTIFLEVKPRTEYPTSFEFFNKGLKYTIGEGGDGKRADRSSATVTFDLRLAKGEILQRVIYFAEYQKDILLIGESYLNDGTGGFIVRLDGRTLKLKWKRAIPAFNVGQGLLVGNIAYITAIGFVGKINLDSGVYVWRHNNLYGQNDSAFNSFELPEIKGKTVVFTECELYLRKNVAKLTIDIRTGKILKTQR